MKDSTNQKHNRKVMVETSNDRNGVVVNRARRGNTCDRLNKRSSESVGRAEVQMQKANCSSEISAKNEHCSGSITIRTVRY